MATARQSDADTMTADMAETVMIMAEHGNNGHAYGYTIGTGVHGKAQRRWAQRRRERPPRGITRHNEGGHNDGEHHDGEHDDGGNGHRKA